MLVITPAWAKQQNLTQVKSKDHPLNIMGLNLRFSYNSPSKPFMTVSTWRNGRGYFKIRFRKDDFEEVENWNTLKIPNYGLITRNNRAFTRKCPEIRSVIIKSFLEANSKDDWTKGKPHRLCVDNLGNNNFELRLLADE